MERNWNETITKAEEWLNDPLRSDMEDAMGTSADLLKQLQEMLQEDGVEKSTVGALIGKVKGMQKTLQSLERVQWVAVEEGHIAIGHRPSAKLMTDLKLQQASHVLTLLSEGEGGLEIQAMAKKNALEWRWFPMASAKPPGEERHAELAGLFLKMEELLKRGGRLYIHCSAGIHRTGMITYAFLRFAGNSPGDAERILGQMRTTTGKGVGKERTAWADEVTAALKGFRE